MFSILKSFVIGSTLDEAETLCRSLRASDIPVSTADCRACTDPCDLGHEAYPRRFNVDWSSNMVGSVKPYSRQVVISTGKADWERDISDEKDSLAAALTQVVSNHPAMTTAPTKPIPLPVSSSSSITTTTTDLEVNISLPKFSPSSAPKPKFLSPPPPHHHTTGVFSSSDSNRISVLNGSHRTLSCEDEHETVLVFPDYKCVLDVPRTSQGALDLWETALDPSLDREGISGECVKSNLKTWVLPYACVILLCSHRKRDNRCGIAAPKLEHAFIKALEARGWDADTHLAHPSLTLGSALEESQEREELMAEQLKESALSKRALIIKVSHIGGHKYAGNAIIYNPSGSGIWYGRVTPHDVDSIVENTIIDGLVLPPLLRGGINLTRPNCKTLNDW